MYLAIDVNETFVIYFMCVLNLGLQKNRSLASLYDRTGVCTIRTLIKNDQNDLRTGTRAEFRPFSEALSVIDKSLMPLILLNENCQNTLGLFTLLRCHQRILN